MIADDPVQFGKFESQHLLGLIPLELHIPLTMNLLFLVIKTQSNPELLMRCIKQSIRLNGNLRLSLILTLIGCDLDISDEIIPESMRQFGEVLAVDADIQHIEGVLMVEVRNIWDLACDDLIVIDAFRA